MTKQEKIEKARAELTRVCDPAWAEFKRICAAAWAEFKRIRETATDDEEEPK